MCVCQGAGRWQKEKHEEKVYLKGSINSTKEFDVSIVEYKICCTEIYLFIYSFITSEVINYPINLVPYHIRSGLG